MALFPIDCRDVNFEVLLEDHYISSDQQKNQFKIPRV